MTDQSFDLDRARSAEMDLAPQQAVETPAEVAAGSAGPGSPPPTPRDQDIWLLANRIEQLHRSATALRGLIARSGPKVAEPVTVTPRDEKRQKF